MFSELRFMSKMKRIFIQFHICNEQFIHLQSKNGYARCAGFYFDFFFFFATSIWYLKRLFDFVTIKSVSNASCLKCKHSKWRLSIAAPYIWAKNKVLRDACLQFDFFDQMLKMIETNSNKRNVCLYALREDLIKTECVVTFCNSSESFNVQRFVGLPYLSIRI